MNDARRKFLQTAGLSAACAAVPRAAFAEEGASEASPPLETAVRRNPRRSSAVKAKPRAWRNSRTG